MHIVCVNACGRANVNKLDIMNSMWGSEDHAWMTKEVVHACLWETLYMVDRKALN